MSRAVYPGSFDPITFGHIDIIKRLTPLYDEVVVLVSSAPSKQYMFTAEQRESLVRTCLDGISKVKVESFSGLTVDYAHKVKADVIIRGIRAVADFELEMAMASINKKLAPDIETMIVFASPQYSYISSRLVKEVALYNGDLNGLVPPAVISAVKNK